MMNRFTRPSRLGPTQTTPAVRSMAQLWAGPALSATSWPSRQAGLPVVVEAPTSGRALYREQAGVERSPRLTRPAQKGNGAWLTWPYVSLPQQVNMPLAVLAQVWEPPALMPA